MKDEYKVIYNGYVITMDEQLGQIPNGAVLIKNSVIVAVANSIAELPEHPSTTEMIDAQGGIVMPGMIDTHRHNWLSLVRGISANESLPEFLMNTFYAYGAVFTAEDMRAAILAGAVEAINAGTTTIFDVVDCINTPEHATAAIESLKESGIRAVFGYGMQAYDFKPAGFSNYQERLKTAELLNRSAFSGADDELVQMGMLLTDMGTVAFDQTAEEIRMARNSGITYASHTGAATTSNLLRGLRELNDHELLLPGHIYAHCNALNDQEWALIAKTGGKVSTTPSSELLMGMGFLPIDACLRHEIPFSFGIDYTGVTNDDLFTQLQLGMKFQRVMDSHRVHETATMPFKLNLDVHDVLAWGIRGGADTLGMEQKIGSLTPGKQADIIIVSQRKAMTPSAFPVGSVVLQTTASDVDTVLIAGQIRKRHGELVGFNVEAIRNNAQAAFQRLQLAAMNFTHKTPAEIAAFFGFAERQAAVNFAQAYDNGYPDFSKL